MSRPARIIVGAGSAIALVAILAMFALRDNRPSPPPAEVPVPVADRSVLSAPAPAVPNLPPQLPVPSAAAPKLRKPAPPEVAKTLDEASLLAKLHVLGPSDPPLSLQLAREAVARFPDSPNAPEFAWNVAKALFNMGRMKEAEAEARVMVKKYPGNYFAGDVEHHLLNHPPNPK